MESKNKQGFIDGTLPQTKEDDPKFKRWKKITTLVCSWIKYHRTIFAIFNHEDENRKAHVG